MPEPAVPEPAGLHELDDRVPERLQRAAVLFSRALRNAGIDISLDSVILFVGSLGELGIERRETVYWAGRSTLINRPEDHDLYDQIFAAFWLDGEAVELTYPAEEQQITLAFDDGEEPPPEGDDDAEEADGPVLSVRFSAKEILRQKDFALCSVDEMAELRRMMDELKVSAALRPSRRQRPSSKRRGRPDLRRTVRHALKNGGEPIRRAHHERGDRPRRLVLIADVSGSMEPYSRALVRFIHAAIVGRSKVEAFAVGTRLTRMTRELGNRDPDAALREASSAVVDWSGGTRIGECLREFNDTWGVRGMARGSIVVILSDGWDRGAPEVLGREMERLQRVAFRVVWVNPLKASPGYAPLAQGMAAALPHVDEFIEGHSLQSIEALAEVLAA